MIRKYLNTFSFMVAGFGVASCGGEVKLNPGPKIKSLIEKESVLQQKEADHAALVKEVDECAASNANSSKKEILSSQISFGMENISAKRSTAAQVIEGRVVSINNLRTSTMAMNKISSSEQNVFEIPLSSENEKTPIIIRANCFFLNENEILKTNGRDLYILADKIKMDGEIDTVPPAVTDRPGKQGGDVKILSVKSDFGSSAKINLSGADGGVITSSPKALLDGDRSEEDKQDIIRLAKEQLTTLREYVDYSRTDSTPSLSDAEFLFEAWEAVVARKIPGVEQADIALYYGNLFGSIDPNNMPYRTWFSSSTREEFPNLKLKDVSLRKKMIRTWAEGFNHFTQPLRAGVRARIEYTTTREELVNPLEIIWEKGIPDFILKSLFEKKEVPLPGKALFKVDRLKFSKLDGGPAGNLEVVGDINQEPKVVAVNGKSQASTPNAPPVFKLDPRECILHLNKSVRRKAIFTITTELGQERSPLNQPDYLTEEYTEPLVRQSSYAKTNFEFADSTHTQTVLESHPHSEDYEKPSTFSFSNKKEDYASALKRWGIKKGSPNYERALNSMTE